MTTHAQIDVAEVVGFVFRSRNWFGHLGLILIGIGLLFASPYAFAVNAHLYGQFKQLTQVTQSEANTFMGDMPPATTG